MGMMKRPAWRLAAAGTLLCAAALAGGEVAAGDGEGDLVAGLRASGAEVRFLGESGALKGWLVSPPGRSSYTLYVDETGHGVMGLLFAPDGGELTKAQVAAARQAGPVRRSGKRDAPEAVPARPEARRADVSPVRLQADGREQPVVSVSAALDLALMAEGFDLGAQGPQTAVFADPTCPPSRAAVAALARRALEGEIRLRVVPVGVRSGHAESLAASVLGSERRARIWLSLYRGGEMPEAGPEAEAGARLNGMLFRRTGSDFVPYALMRRADGSVVSAVGMDFQRWFGGGAGQ
ncbi:MAG: hypothetical protein OXH50_05650 [Gemmatimonadetes bacterium]|nr:hypothetical protein [Gemmatimonadota bacterium]